MTEYVRQELRAMVGARTGGSARHQQALSLSQQSPDLDILSFDISTPGNDFNIMRGEKNSISLLKNRIYKTSLYWLLRKLGHIFLMDDNDSLLELLESIASMILMYNLLYDLSSFILKPIIFFCKALFYTINHIMKNQLMAEFFLII